MDVKLIQIGVIHSTHKQAAGTPIQPCMADAAEGWVEVFHEYTEALADLDGFERVWLIYWFDRATGGKLKVKPFLDDTERGLFATRAPCRPNPIGMSAVRLLGIAGARIRIADVDILDGTPLLDIKPYVPRFDSYPQARAGWLDKETSRRRDDVKADNRFDEKGC